jgi:hypothetical protein
VKEFGSISDASYCFIAAPKTGRAPPPACGCLEVKSYPGAFPFSLLPSLLCIIHIEIIIPFQVLEKGKCISSQKITIT